MIDDFDNGGKTVCEFAVGEEDDAADFHIPPVRRGELDFGHYFLAGCGFEREATCQFMLFFVWLEGERLRVCVHEYW